MPLSLSLEPWRFRLGGTDAARPPGRRAAMPRCLRAVASDPTVMALDEADAGDLAAVHRDAFPADGDHWDGAAFRGFLSAPGVFGAKAVRASGARRDGALLGFVLVREVAGEAEILTLAVRRNARGRGLGRLLMDDALRALYARRTETLFLEVDAGNEPAVRLYRRLGFREVGRRTGYYAREGEAATALVLRLDL